MHNDIPEAQRQQVSLTKRPSPSMGPIPIWLGIGGVVISGLILLWGLWKPWDSSGDRTQGTNFEVSNSPESENTALLGHLPYAEAPSAELQPLLSDSQVSLRFAAAQAYEAMTADALQAGIQLVALSGFRSKADQEVLFFKVKEERNQPTQKRAEVSAPPGHSEHHTGYAVDIGDADYPNSNLEESFEQTAAFEWLQQNAARYSFELSFPRDNPQGVSYEPWHWRYVGDENSLKTFYKGKS